MYPSVSTTIGRRGGHGLATLLALAGLVPALAACGLFAKAPPAPDPFAEGVLNAAAQRAPAASASQSLALLAREMGWEQEVSENGMLRKAIAGNAFQAQVEPFLMALFYKHGYSILSQAGEGHEFSRDTVLRGPASNVRFLVTTRRSIHVIFLGPTDNVQLIYPQDGEPPQVYALRPDGALAVRQSRLETYLR